MIVMRKPMDRRQLLRGGLGVALSLPLMDAMVGNAKAADRVASIKRFQSFYTPNGMIMQKFTPSGNDTDFELSQTLSPLQPFKSKLAVMTGLAHSNTGLRGGHAQNCAGLLTGADIRNTDGYDIKCGVSIDQIAAKKFGQETPIPSLEMGIDPPNMTGTCVVSYGCAYTNTLSWRDEVTPLPVEANPRAIFERLFGDGDTADAAARQAQLSRQASILDFVMDDASRLSGRLGADDKRKMDQYMTSVRDVERRIQKAQASTVDIDTGDLTRPSGIPAEFKDHVHMMIDLQVLAMQADQTRVGNLMIGREISNRTYPEIGVPDAHHMISHHANDPERIDKLARINKYHFEMLAYMLKRLDETKHGEQSLLDGTIVMSGAALGDSQNHEDHNLPITVSGGLIRGGQHVAMPLGTGKSNLLLTILHQLGLEQDKIGDSSKLIPELIV